MEVLYVFRCFGHLSNPLHTLIPVLGRNSHVLPELQLPVPESFDCGEFAGCNDFCLLVSGLRYSASVVVPDGFSLGITACGRRLVPFAIVTVSTVVSAVTSSSPSFVLSIFLLAAPPVIVFILRLNGLFAAAPPAEPTAPPDACAVSCGCWPPDDDAAALPKVVPAVVRAGPSSTGGRNGAGEIEGAFGCNSASRAWPTIPVISRAVLCCGAALCSGGALTGGLSPVGTVVDCAVVVAAETSAVGELVAWASALLSASDSCSRRWRS